jgi:hypothetical protein
MMQQKSLFTTEDSAHRNGCTSCRWEGTNMCPKNIYFVGRFLGNRKSIPWATGCHRYAATNQEIQKRQESLVRKLHVGL